MSFRGYIQQICCSDNAIELNIIFRVGLQIGLKPGHAFINCHELKLVAIDAETHLGFSPNEGSHSRSSFGAAPCHQTTALMEWVLQNLITGGESSHEGSMEFEQLCFRLQYFTRNGVKSSDSNPVILLYDHRCKGIHFDHGTCMC